MNSACISGRWPTVVFLFMLALVAPACNGEQEAEPARPQPSTQPKRTPLGKNVYFEKLEDDRRRVVVTSYVCLREGQLEGFLTRKGTKEHEYILAADVDALDIHKALIAAKAEYGHPVKFGPGDKYTPAKGSRIKVFVQYRKNGKDGKLITLPAQQWIRDARTRKPLEFDWVFGGSRFVEDPDHPKRPKFYEANAGDIICLCNMPTAMLDLPVVSPKSMELRSFEANPELIPPLNSRVDVILEVIPERIEPPPPASQQSDKKEE